MLRSFAVAFVLCVFAAPALAQGKPWDPNEDDSAKISPWDEGDPSDRIRQIRLGGWSRFVFDQSPELIVWAPEGERYAAILADGTCQIVDVASSRTKRRHPFGGALPVDAFWKSDDTAVFLFKDGRVACHILKSGNKTWEGHLLAGTRDVAIALFGNGERALSIDGQGGGRVSETSTSRQLVALTGIPVSPVSLSISGDLTRIALADAEGVVTISDLKSGEPLREWKRKAGLGSGLALNADGTRLVTAAADGKVRLWDVDSGEMLREQKLEEPLSLPRLTILDRPRHVLVTDQGGAVIRLHADTLEVLSSRRFRLDDIRFTSHSPSGLRMAVVRPLQVAVPGGEDARRVISEDWEIGRIRGADFSQDGASVVSLSYSGELRISDARTGVLLANTSVPSRKCLVTYDERSFALVNGDGDVEIREFEAPARVRVIPREPGERYTRLFADGQGGLWGLGGSLRRIVPEPGPGPEIPSGLDRGSPASITGPSGSASLALFGKDGASFGSLKPGATWSTVTPYFDRVAVDESGTLLLGVNGRLLRLWRAGSVEAEWQVMLRQPPEALAVSSASGTYVLSENENDLRLGSVEDGTNHLVTSHYSRGPIRKFKFDNSGRRILATPKDASAYVLEIRISK